MNLPNQAGDHPETDQILRDELKLAGIQTLQEAAGRDEDFLAAIIRSNCGEVKTSVEGVLISWSFKRAWNYWVCAGPGIDVETAEKLHKTNGKTVRVAGHCGCPSPREYYKGLACGLYHVDDVIGLKALADTIKSLTSVSV